MFGKDKNMKVISKLSNSKREIKKCIKKNKHLFGSSFKSTCNDCDFTKACMRMRKTMGV